MICAGTIVDQNTQQCIGASSNPTMGQLYPLTTQLNVTPGGSVGVGTATPYGRLHVLGAGGGSFQVFDFAGAGGVNLVAEFHGGTGFGPQMRLTGAGGYVDIGQSSAGDFVVETNDAPRLTVTQGGNVGIGTTTPGSGYMLDVNGHMKVGSTGFTEQGLTLRSSNGIWQLGSNNEGNGSNNNQFYIWDAATLRYFLSVQRSTGNVGINTTTPASRFEVYDDNTASIRVRGTSNANPSEIYFDKTAAGSQHRAAMGYRPAQGAFVWVNGADRLTIDTAGLVSVKQSLEIRGGADIVERFESSCGALEPGTVVSIDPHNAGKLACAAGAYDTKVAGVVSGAGGVQPGLCLSQDGMLDGDTPVAMNGRVYVKCTASNGAIAPGDRLTTADLAGHAMKVTDSARADGAVIGKAMTSLESGEGLVLVLVNLQ